MSLSQLNDTTILSPHRLNTILTTLSRDYQTTPAALILSLLRSREHQGDEAFNDFACRSDELLEEMQLHPRCSGTFLERARRTVTGRCKEEIAELASRSGEYHFKAKTMTEEQIRAYKVSEAIQETSRCAPMLWGILSSLLAADETVNARRSFLIRRRHEKRTEAQKAASRLPLSEVVVEAHHYDEDSDEDHDEPEDGVFLDDSDDEPEDGVDQSEERRARLTDIRALLCASILMKSSNQHCNAFQSIVGIFLHATNTPETVREFLSSLGVSIATTTINVGVRSLSKAARKKMKNLGKSLQVLFAYDNLDIDLKQSALALGNERDSLVHLTTGTMLPLHPSVTPADLDCADELWEKCKPGSASNIELVQLMSLHASPADADGLRGRDRFNRWKFLHDLVHHGPEYFRQFKGDLGEAEVYEAVAPIQQTFQVPNETLDIAPSTPASNAKAIEEFLMQAGIGDPEDSPCEADVRNQVILISGDLLTGERIRSLLISRSEERTKWRRMQYIVYVPGLFHLKMAAAEAIWRVFLQLKEAREDDTSLMELLRQIRPHETGKLGSKPGFRRMHEAIDHVGIVLHLDCWRLAIKKRFVGCDSLEEFANQRPDWDSLVNIASHLCKESVASVDIESTVRAREDLERDCQQENTSILQQYCLLYEELSYGMNYGDIGRVEACFFPWMMVFAGCGKHKYAAELQRYLEDINFRYPAGLRKAVRMNILCNPTGKKGKFRGIDWLVEHNNLYIKRIYGGKYSNHTKSHIINESQLIEVYKDTRMQFEKMFCLNHKTTRHSPPKMVKTFKSLALYMEKERVNEYVPGRKTKHKIPDVMGQGLATINRKMDQQNDLVNEEVLEEELIELQDDGGLDV